MTDATVFLNGAFLPRDEAVLPATDWGVFGGDGAYEVTRTFGHRPFRLEDHIDRLFRSLKYARIDCGFDRDELVAISREVLTRNAQGLAADDDHLLWQKVARADPFSGPGTPATVVVHCMDLKLGLIAKDYLHGVRLMTPGIRRTPPQCIDPKAKLNSRMNQVLGMLEARQAGDGMIPLFLDVDGNVAETNLANFFFAADGVLMTPRPRNVLGGVTRQTICGLAGGLGIELREGDYTVHDVYNADEAFISGTSATIVPARSLNGVVIGSDENVFPCPVTLALQKAFIELVGLDFVAQALRHADGVKVSN